MSALTPRIYSADATHPPVGHVLQSLVASNLQADRLMLCLLLLSCLLSLPIAWLYTDISMALKTAPLLAGLGASFTPPHADGR